MMVLIIKMMNNDKVKKVLRAGSLENQVLKARKFSFSDESEFVLAFNKIDSAVDKLDVEKDSYYLEKRRGAFNSGRNFYNVINSGLRTVYSFDDLSAPESGNCSWDFSNKEKKDLAFKYRIYLRSDYRKLLNGIESFSYLMNKLKVGSLNDLKKAKKTFLENAGEFYDFVDLKFRDCE